MVHIMNLPNEILYRIFQFINTIDRCKILSLVSVTFYALCKNNKMKENPIKYIIQYDSFDMVQKLYINHKFGIFKSPSYMDLLFETFKYHHECKIINMLYLHEKWFWSIIENKKIQSILISKLWNSYAILDLLNRLKYRYLEAYGLLEELYDSTYCAFLQKGCIEKVKTLFDKAKQNGFSRASNIDKYSYYSQLAYQSGNPECIMWCHEKHCVQMQQK